MFSKFRESRTKRLAARRLDDGSQLCVGDDYKEIAALVDRYVVHHRNWYRHRPEWSGAGSGSSASG